MVGGIGVNVMSLMQPLMRNSDGSIQTSIQRAAESPQIRSINQNTLLDFFSFQSIGSPTSIRAIQEAARREAGELSPAGLPPWENQARSRAQALQTEEELFQEIISRDSLFRPGEDLDASTTAEGDAGNLFIFYEALDRLTRLGEYLETGAQRDNLRTILEAQFQREVAEFDAKFGETNFGGFELTRGFASDTQLSGKILQDASSSFSSKAITTNFAEAIDGLTGTEVFNIDIDNIVSGTNTSIEVDLADLATSTSTIDIAVTVDGSTTQRTVNVIRDGSEPPEGTTDLYLRVDGTTLSHDNVAKLMNIALDAAQSGSFIESRSEVVDDEFTGKRFFNMIPGLNEKISFSVDSGAREEALYVTGFDGEGNFSNGYVAKLTDLSNPGGPTEAWRENIDSTEGADFTFDDAEAVVTDSRGNIYVVGTTHGEIGGQVNQVESGTEVYLRKFDSTGTEIFARPLGARDTTKVFDLKIDANDNLVIAGQTTANLNADATGGLIDSFVTKFDANGEEKWTYQSPVDSNDSALGIAFDAAGDVYVTGTTRAAITGDVTQGAGGDAYMLKLSGSTGTVANSLQFADAATTQGTAMTVDAAGNIYVAGDDGTNGFLRQYDSNFNLMWSQDLGAVKPGSVEGLALSGTDIIVSATTTGNDITVQQFSNDSTAGWSTTVGGSGVEEGGGITVTSDGIYISGSTASSLDGVTSPPADAPDSFVRKLDPTTGTEIWTRQFGGGLATGATGVAHTSFGSSVLETLGLSQGSVIFQEENGAVDPIVTLDRDVTSQSSVRAGDYFTIRVNDERAQRVTIENGESLRGLSLRIREMLGVHGSVETAFADGGTGLRFVAFDGNRISIEPGAEGQDALVGLRLEPNTVYGKVRNPDTGDLETVEGVFDLRLPTSFDVSNDENAGEAKDLLGFARNQLKDAYNHLFGLESETDRLLAENERQGNIADAPAYLQAQIARLQDGLNRVTAINQSNGIFA